MSEKLEENLLEWIEGRRARGSRGLCKLMKKAKIVYQDLQEGNHMDENFKASRGWFTNFIKRNGLSLRRKISVAQQETERMVPKLV